MRKRFGTALVVALVLAGAAPAAASASPGGRLTAATAFAKAGKPKKPPAFRAVLVNGSEKATLTYSVDTFATKGTAAPKGDRIVAWAASFGDFTKGVAGTGLPKTISHRYYRRGDYTVTFTVTDARGKRTTGRFQRSVTGAYRVPDVFATVKTAVLGAYLEAGVPVTLTAKVLSWNHIRSAVTVDFADRTRATAPVQGSTAVLTHVFADAGMYRVNVSARDGRGGYNNAQLLVHVGSAPATQIAVQGGYAQVGVPALITLTEVPAAHEKATALPTFDAGGGTVASAPAGSGGSYLVTWWTPGPKTMRATVVGAVTHVSFTTSAEVDVPVPLPLAVNLSGGSGKGSTGLDAQNDPTGPIPFGASPVLNGRTVVAWDLDPGDGGGDLDGTGAFPFEPVYYPVAGAYTATLALELDDGSVITGTAAIDIADPPTLSVTPSPATLSGGVVLGLSVNATFHDDAVGAVTYVYWNATSASGPEGFPGTPPTVIGHTYAADGSYVVEVVVEDDHNGSTTQFVHVTP